MESKDGSLILRSECFLAISSMYSCNVAVPLCLEAEFPILQFYYEYAYCLNQFIVWTLLYFYGSINLLRQHWASVDAITTCSAMLRITSHLQREGCDADSVTGATYLREIYDASAKKLGATGVWPTGLKQQFHTLPPLQPDIYYNLLPGFKGKTTVPTLYDRKLGRVVSTESADILRMLNSEFNEFCSTQQHKDLDLYPADVQKEIEEVEGWTTK